MVMSGRGVFTMERSCFGGAGGGGFGGLGLSKRVQDGGMADSELSREIYDDAACCRLLGRSEESSAISIGLSVTLERQTLCWTMGFRLVSQSVSWLGKHLQVRRSRHTGFSWEEKILTAVQWCKGSVDLFDWVVFSARSLYDIDEVIAEGFRDGRQFLLLCFRECRLDNNIDRV